METLIEIAKILVGAAFGGIVGHYYICWLAVLTTSMATRLTTG